MRRTSRERTGNGHVPGSLTFNAKIIWLVFNDISESNVDKFKQSKTLLAIRSITLHSMLKKYFFFLFSTQSLFNPSVNLTGSAANKSR